MSSFQFSPDAFHFNSTFAGIPVVIEYEVEVSEDHRGADVEVIPLVCVIDGHAVDLCEDAGLFHSQQLQTWLAEAQSHAKDGGGDFDGDDYTPNAYDAAAAEDRWIAECDRVHYARAGL